MNKPLREGGTVGDSFDVYQRMTGKRHPQWQDVQAPDALLYLFGWFWEIANGRPVTMGALLPIPSTEMLAWSQLTKTPLRLWEIETIRLLDQAFLRVMAEKD